MMPILQQIPLRLARTYVTKYGGKNCCSMPRRIHSHPLIDFAGPKKISSRSPRNDPYSTLEFKMCEFKMFGSALDAKWESFRFEVRATIWKAYRWSVALLRDCTLTPTWPFDDRSRFGNAVWPIGQVCTTLTF